MKEIAFFRIDNLAIFIAFIIADIVFYLTGTLTLLSIGWLACGIIRWVSKR